MPSSLYLAGETSDVDETIAGGNMENIDEISMDSRAGLKTRPYTYLL
jgi:hypothetical protein